MRFEFATATRIIFGSGTIQEIGGVAREFGRRAFVVTGRDPRRAESLIARLRAADVDVCTYRIAHEPTVDDISDAVKNARDAKCDLVIGFGGGAVLDAAKAISALLTNTGEALDYLEVIGRGRTLAVPGAPCIAIPTTAGTGSEVTRNAVLASPANRVKVSMRSPYMLPRVALIDPELTHALPPALTASTGLDALTQLIEPYISSRANPLIDALCLDGIRRVARSLRRCFANGLDATAREDMALASLFGGLALANAGLGAVHGLAGPIGGMFPAPHGAVCAALLPATLDANLSALRERRPNSPILDRLDDVGRTLTGDPCAEAMHGVEWIRTLVSDLQIPGLRTYDVTPDDFAAIAAAAAQASSMKANPIALTLAELHEILQRAL